MVQSMLTGLHGIDIITPGTSTVGYVQDFDTDSFGRFQFASNTASDKRLLLCLDSLPTHSPLITEKVVWTSLLSARRWLPAYQHWANPIWHTDLRATAKLMIFYHNKQDLYEKISIPSDFNIQTTKKSTFAYFFAGKYIYKVFERRMRKVYWLSVTFLILVKSGEDRRRREYDKMRQRNVTYP